MSLTVRTVQYVRVQHEIISKRNLENLHVVILEHRTQGDENIAGIDLNITAKYKTRFKAKLMIFICFIRILKLRSLRGDSDTATPTHATHLHRLQGQTNPTYTFKRSRRRVGHRVELTDTNFKTPVRRHYPLSDLAKLPGVVDLHDNFREYCRVAG